MRIRRWLWVNALALVMFGLFAGFLVAQSIFGWHTDNDDRIEHGQPEQSYLAYLSSGHFVEATFENWESEFLQMGSYVLLTAYLVQRGSAESKPIRNADPRHDSTSTGRWIVDNGLALALIGMFVLSFVAHLFGGTAAYNDEQRAHDGTELSPLEFLRTSEFWFQSMQNWQSEFLAVGVLIVFSIFLRQRGSPQSKKVSDPNAKTGT